MILLVLLKIFHFTEICEVFEDVDDQLYVFGTLFMHVYDRHVPLKQNEQPSFMNKNLK